MLGQSEESRQRLGHSPCQPEDTGAEEALNLVVLNSMSATECSSSIDSVSPQSNMKIIIHLLTSHKNIGNPHERPAETFPVILFRYVLWNSHESECH